ncbi:MAG: LysR family transcriptional regulator [Spirochaetaceae bacterium]|nr:LysR family transcriptional regulator [Spirochaetaceae bacterium]
MQNFELYKVFYMAAESGSLSKAAEKLFITQPAVSQSIKLLENNLGIHLFIRTSRGIILTREGEKLYDYVKQSYLLLSHGEKMIEEMKNMASGEVSIGASDTMCKYYLLPYLNDFHINYPEVHLKVTNRISSETIKLLKSGEVDVGFINLPYEDKSITLYEGITIHDCFVVGEKYKFLTDEPINPETLTDYPLMLLEKGSSIRQFIDTYFEDHDIKVSPEIELGSIDLLIKFARIGVGISCVVKEFAWKELKRGDLYELKLTNELPRRQIGIATLKNIPLSVASKKFVQSIVQSYTD